VPTKHPRSGNSSQILYFAENLNMAASFTQKGNIVDIEKQEIYFGEVVVRNGFISAIQRISGEEPGAPYLLPGFIDSHIHIESSMLIPSEFARLAVVHGTVATISDPHEIANVCGKEGVDFMISNGKTVPFKFHFGAPSCVPATVFETAGAALDSTAVKEMLLSDDIYYLSEMMNFPGVLHNDSEVMKKIAAAKEVNKPVDGHAPGLMGEQAAQYIAAGISTDHECFTEAEAADKLKHGMKIIVREGSAAKNFEALIGLMHDHSDNMMFCSDDKHPDNLVLGHINRLCARAVAKNINVFKVLKAACINPVKHYKMRVGLMQPGDAADFIMVEDLKNFNVTATYINGEKVAENGETYIQSQESGAINNFNCAAVSVRDVQIDAESFPQVSGRVPVITALDGQLITPKLFVQPELLENNGALVSNPEHDILKIVVVNRYKPAEVKKGFIKNFGFKEGAIASSVAHDSHNIIAVGVNDEAIVSAINLVVEAKGGVSCVSENNSAVLRLPVAGLMSNEDGYEVAAKYTKIDNMAKSLGSDLEAPFMTLSFMGLLVIPHIKMSDLGLFDGDSFSFI